MEIKVDITGNQIKIMNGDESVRYPLGSISCMFAEGEWHTLLSFLDIERNLKKLEAYANNFLEKCFYSTDILKKINGYMLCDAELNLSSRKYTSNKIISGRMTDGKEEMIVTDIYNISSPIDLINLEMMYAVIEDVTITKCKNCGKYFVAGKVGAQYCDRIYSDNRTCKQIGAKKFYNENLNENEALKLYEKVYQATYYKLRKAKSKEERMPIHERILELKLHRQLYKNDLITEEDFVKFLVK